MKILSFILLIATQINCTASKVSVDTAPTPYIIISSDTTINNTWALPQGSIVKFVGNGHIHGNGSLSGFIVDASPYQYIFDTTLTLSNIKSYNKEVSVMWFGASSSVADNYNNLMKAFNFTISNGLWNCFIPCGVYNYSKSLTLCNIYKGLYTATAIHLYGESSFWNSRSVLSYKGLTGFGLGIQVGKGSEINNLDITGQFIPPPIVYPAYYNIPIDSFGTNANNMGLVVDYDGSKNSSGSTGCKIHDVTISNFGTDIIVSPTGTYNGDILIFENLHFSNSKFGFVSCQAQEKGNVIRGIYSWGVMHTLISIGNAGKFQAGNYTIDGGNIAGNCIRLFNISEAGWFASSVSNLFAEGIAQIGIVTAGDSKNVLATTFKNIQVTFAPISQAGVQKLLSTNNRSIKFIDCNFRYYGDNISQLYMSGYATFDNVQLSGLMYAPVNGFLIK